ncbi:MAG: signal recognition particle-docking protein FtsY [Methylacidiphilales bacterium]|nr:signal recognition particle-docking protein FtsY [Candidatus Methylacidiphilales bacterium]
MVFNWFRRQYNESSDNPSTEKESETSTPKESQAQEAQTKSTEATTPENPKPDNSTANSTPDAAADMLAFAKAAYQNIQQKQQTENIDVKQADSVEVAGAVIETTSPEKISEEITGDTAAVIETVETQSEVTEDENINENISENISEQVTEVTEIPEIESVVDDSEPATEIISTQTDSPATDSPATNTTLANEFVESQTTSEENISETPAPAALSFLERAAAERQAKQERLIASAILPGGVADAIAFPELETQPGVKPNTPVTPAASEINLENNLENNVETTTEAPDLDFDEGFVWSTDVLAAQGRRPEDISIEEINWLKKLRQGLDKTRRSILNQLKSIVGQGPLNQAAVMEIEALLLQADVGVEATDFIIDALQQKLREEVLPPDAAIAYLKQIIRDMLDNPIQKSSKSAFAPEKDTLNIWLMTGVNGAGKTTTIGKLAHLSQKSGYKTLIGAADTFRAAAVEQVKVWGTRSGVEVVSNPGKNTDPAAVVFDAIAAAVARDTELLLVDTAGRLQNKKNLMEELSKIRRIIDKKAPNAKVESLLVLDATLGQNGLRQAEVFSQAAQLSGVVLTKLDGTAKGGVALAVVKQLGLPIRFIGAGEGIEDLRPFSSYEFVEALLSG